MKINFSRSIVAGMAAMFLVLGLSCSGTGNDEANGDMVDTASYTAQSDTLSDLYGRVVGQSLKKELTTYIAEYGDTAYNIADFVDGLEAVAGHRRPMVYISGQTLGMRMESGDLTGLDNSVVKIDRAKIMAALKTAMKSDSIGAFDQQICSAAFETALNHFAADTTSVTAADSLAEAYGTMIGMSIAAELKARKDVTTKEKTDFLAGIEAIVGKGYSPEFYAGMSSGISIVHNLAAIEAKGVNVRREVVVDRIREAFDNSPLSQTERTTLEKQLNDLQKSIFEKWEEREEQRLSKTDEAIQNAKTGEALVAKFKKENPEAQTTPSGLTYIIKDAGSQPHIKAGDRIKAKYVGSHLDGKVFDSNNDALLLVDQMVPGLTEGLKMLGKGAKATFWVPGKLGYKGKGVPQAGIGPMETLVFDIEILDIVE